MDGYGIMSNVIFYDTEYRIGEPVDLRGVSNWRDEIKMIESLYGVTWNNEYRCFDSNRRSDYSHTEKRKNIPKRFKNRDWYIIWLWENKVGNSIVVPDFDDRCALILRMMDSVPEFKYRQEYRLLCFLPPLPPGA